MLWFLKVHAADLIGTSYNDSEKPFDNRANP